MKTNKLTFKGIKNVLSKDEMKNIMAGSGHCLNVGAACNDDVQCCTTWCAYDPDQPSTHKSCRQY
jgi:hypothetical protein